MLFGSHFLGLELALPMLTKLSAQLQETPTLPVLHRREQRQKIHTDGAAALVVRLSPMDVANTKSTWKTGNEKSGESATC